MEKENEFFEFVYKRQLIWYKRFVLKEGPPWTNDEVLKNYKIINMYRELDRCTQYIIKKLDGIGNRNIVLFNVVFYRFFNLDRLYEQLGIDVIKSYEEDDKKDIMRRFENIVRMGRPTFNDAYLIASGGKDTTKYITIIENLSNLKCEELISRLDECKKPKDALKIIIGIPLVGPFLACEIWTDLSYLNFFRQKWRDNDFVNIGPGAKWGLEIIYGGKLKKKEQEEKLQHLYNVQKEKLHDIHKTLNENLPWEDIAYKDAYSNYPYLSITNIEGALCEFRKYNRLKQGLGKKRYYKHKIEL